MQSVTRDQVAQFGARVLQDVDWGSIEKGHFQSILELPREELAARLTTFVRRGCCTISVDGNFKVDRNSYSLAEIANKYLGTGGAIIQMDSRSERLHEVSFAQVRFEGHFCKAGSTVDGEEKLRALRAAGCVALDPQIGYALFMEKGQAMLKRLYEAHQVGWIEFAGGVLLGRGNVRYLLDLSRNPDGTWKCGAFPLSEAGERGFSPVI